MVITTPLSDGKIREKDCHGSGCYGSSRNRVKNGKVVKKKHNGVDFLWCKGDLVSSVVDGVITKTHGLIYSAEDKSKWRYIEIEDGDGYKSRYFYVDCDSCLRAGSKVERGQVIGIAQGIEDLYQNITPHIHFEVKDSKGEYINPIKFLERVEDEYIW